MKGLNKMRWTKRIEWLPLIAAMLMIGVAAMAAKVEKVEFLNDSGAYDGVVTLDRTGNLLTTSQTIYSSKVAAGVTGELYSAASKFLYYQTTGASGNWAGTGVAGSGAIWFRTGYTTGYEFWMLPTGQFGFGTAAPTAGYKVEIVGAAKITGNASIAGRLYSGKLASAPASPAEGDQFYNSTTHKLQVYDGSTWQNCW